MRAFIIVFCLCSALAVPTMADSLHVYDTFDAPGSYQFFTCDQASGWRPLELTLTQTESPGEPMTLWQVITEAGGNWAYWKDYSFTIAGKGFRTYKEWPDAPEMTHRTSCNWIRFSGGMGGTCSYPTGSETLWGWAMSATANTTDPTSLWPTDRQSDPRWADHLLGYSQVRVLGGHRGEGCWLFSAAANLSMIGCPVGNGDSLNTGLKNMKYLTGSRQGQRYPAFSGSVNGDPNAVIEYARRCGFPNVGYKRGVPVGELLQRGKYFFGKVADRGHFVGITDFYKYGSSWTYGIYDPQTPGADPDQAPAPRAVTAAYYGGIDSTRCFYLKTPLRNSAFTSWASAVTDFVTSVAQTQNTTDVTQSQVSVNSSTETSGAELSDLPPLPPGWDPSDMSAYSGLMDTPTTDTVVAAESEPDDDDSTDLSESELSGDPVPPDWGCSNISISCDLPVALKQGDTVVAESEPGGYEEGDSGATSSDGDYVLEMSTGLPSGTYTAEITGGPGASYSMNVVDYDYDNTPTETAYTGVTGSDGIATVPLTHAICKVDLWDVARITGPGTQIRLGNGGRAAHITAVGPGWFMIQAMNTLTPAVKVRYSGTVSVGVLSQLDATVGADGIWDAVADSITYVADDLDTPAAMCTVPEQVTGTFNLFCRVVGNVTGPNELNGCLTTSGVTLPAVGTTVAVNGVYADGVFYSSKDEVDTY